MTNPLANNPKLGDIAMNPCVPTWDIQSSKKSTKALWVHLEGSLYESRCGRLRVQAVKIGPGPADKTFVSYMNIPGYGWRYIGPDSTSLSAAILRCNNAIEQGVFDTAVNH